MSGSSSSSRWGQTERYQPLGCRAVGFSDFLVRGKREREKGGQNRMT